VGATVAQETGVKDDVEQGHKLAVYICSYCHIVEPGRFNAPILRPPAPAFDSIAKRKDMSIVALRRFLATTHRDVRTRSGMSNPQLTESQIDRVAAYLMSLRQTR
jgi:mono/diheme cytochrome c family protein